MEAILCSVFMLEHSQGSFVDVHLLWEGPDVYSEEKDFAGEHAGVRTCAAKCQVLFWCEEVLSVSSAADF